MKHIFIINPHAGASDKSEYVLSKIEEAFLSDDEEFLEFITEYPGHATELVQSMCAFFPEETIRFYACGGLGTVSEVVNGITDFEKAEVAVFPIVLENDILSAFPILSSRFCDINLLKKGRTMNIDLIQCNDLYAINHVNFGVEAKVGRDLNNTSLRRLGFIHPHLPYLLSVLKNFIFTKKLNFAFEINGQRFQKSCSLIAVMNGIRYGRSFYPCKSSKINDGILNVSLGTIPTKALNPKILKAYQSKEETDIPSIFLEYCTTSLKAALRDGTRFLFNYDGLYAEAYELNIKVLPGVLKFVLPEVNSFEK